MNQRPLAIARGLFYGYWMGAIPVLNGNQEVDKWFSIFTEKQQFQDALARI